MSVQRAYNVWKTGIVLKIKKSLVEEDKFPWQVVAISKTLKEKFGEEIILKVFDIFKTHGEAVEAIPHIKYSIEKHKFPR